MLPFHFPLNQHSYFNLKCCAIQKHEILPDFDNTKVYKEVSSKNFIYNLIYRHSASHCHLVAENSISLKP